MKEKDFKLLSQLYRLLDSAERMGAEIDEPEGARYIQISDTLANQLADDLFNVLADNE